MLPFLDKCSVVYTVCLAVHQLAAPLHDSTGVKPLSFWLQGCPCTEQDVCASDNLGYFSDGNCDPRRFQWFWPHGGTPSPPHCAPPVTTTVIVLVIAWLLPSS